MSVRIVLTTASAPGAVAIVQLHGEGVAAVLRQLTGVGDWPVSRVRHARFAEIDDGIAVRLREDWAQVMPHGGPRVVQRIIEHLVSLGCVYEPHMASRELYPEATSDLEADMLATLARAASPAAIDLLLRQPANWRRWIVERDGPDLLSFSRVLQRLIDPPSVVVIGQPNVGKSTLTNRLLGRAASIVADLPGTTRDWVAGLAELPGGIAVRWMDTPGLRSSDDAIEQQAIRAANQIIAAADVLIAMRDPQIGWPRLEAMPREPDLWVMNKIDAVSDAGITGDGTAKVLPLPISAATGAGVDALSSAVINRLGLAAIDSSEAWAFSEELRQIIERGAGESLRRYCGL